MRHHKDMSAIVSVKVFNAEGQLVGPVDVPRIVNTDAEWRALLTPEQFEVARAQGTERPFCGTLLDNKSHGVYACVCCNLPLFASNAKFDSGTGWPSFFQPVADENVATKPDRSHGVLRVEIMCARCDAHLGHVFPDGPPPTYRRHCVNSESLTFVDVEDLKSLADPAAP
jgi:methionine-R-sulfoxide reductase